jgi:hypothetical protein
MIDKKLIIDFVKFLTINHGDETWFNAIQGDFESYVQKKFAYYLSTIPNKNLNIIIEQTINNRRIDLQIVNVGNTYKTTYNIEFKSVHNDVARSFLSSYHSGIKQIKKLPINNKNFLIITATHFNNIINNPLHGLFYKGRVKKSGNGVLFKPSQSKTWSNLYGPNPSSAASFNFKHITIEFYLFP